MEQIDYSKTIEVLKASPQLYNDEMKAMAVMDLHTRFAEDRMISHNITDNLPTIVKNGFSIFTMKSKWNGTVFLVGSGPSLDKNIDELKNSLNKGLVIACTSTLRALEKKGIQPHFTLVADPAPEAYDQVKDIPCDNYIIAAMASHPELFEKFGDKVITCILKRPFEMMIEENYAPFGFLEAWGSVSTMGFSFAEHLGAKKIVLVGMDFSHEGEKHHSEALDLMAGITPTDVLLQYKNYILKMIRASKATVINATEGGSLTEIECKTLKEVNESLPDIKVEIPLPVKNHSKQNRNKLCDFLKGKVVYFKKYRSKIKAALDTNKGIAELILLRKTLYNNVQNARLMEYWSIRPAYIFLYEELQLNNRQAPIEEYAQLHREYLFRIYNYCGDIIERFEKIIKIISKNDQK